MQALDVNQFLKERSVAWDELEALIGRIERRGMRALGLAGARRFGKLHRAVSSDLLRARTELVDAAVVDYLNDLIARSYAHIYSRRASRSRRIWQFYAAEFPRLFRAEWKPIALATAVLAAGMAVGGTFTAIDPQARSVLIPEGHQERTPGERVAAEEGTGGARSGQRAIGFSSFLFTHNIKVTFLAFSLGITFGVGTILVMFFNGVPLGALAMQYHQSGSGLFFWAWILPHGVVELTAICIAGGAGLVLARGVCMPGRRPRRVALVAEAKRAAKLVVGCMPLLVVAGFIEGTISQIHEPALPYVAKLGFAGFVGAAVYGYLLLGGRAGHATG